MNITDIVRDGKRVTFSHYQDGNLWYLTEESSFLFPVPISHLGTAKVMGVEKAILFMRYIRLHAEFLQKAKDNPFSEVP